MQTRTRITRDGAVVGVNDGFEEAHKVFRVSCNQILLQNKPAGNSHNKIAGQIDPTAIFHGQSSGFSGPSAEAFGRLCWSIIYTSSLFAPSSGIYGTSGDRLGLSAESFGVIFTSFGVAAELFGLSAGSNGSSGDRLGTAETSCFRYFQLFLNIFPLLAVLILESR
jgi:hypothetical protein